VGRHVLSELEVRRNRTDDLPLDRVADQLTRMIEEFDSVAKTAEYFLADLGPVTPAIALPLLRPVSVGLANRRETPEDLAEQFRNVWGGVEVMGGDPRDRLLAAELLNGSSSSMEKLFSPIMSSTEKIRAELGSAAWSVTPATILHIAAGNDQPVALDAYFRVRRSAGSDEAAALLVALYPDPAPALVRRDSLANAFGGASTDSADALHAATYLTAVGGDAATAGRTRDIAGALGDRFAEPLTPAAVLSDHVHMSAGEIVNWIDKAIGILRTRQLAPTERELAALAVGLVHGLPESEFLSPTDARNSAASPVSVPALTALHAWIYRPLLGSFGSVVSPEPTV
jgi:hypothetical protein